jgi:uncharacterized protein (UPF0332 family)
MSRAENVVKWCLNKAKSEIEKGEMHRGLIEIKPDEKLAWDHVKKAEHNLEAFIYNKEGGFYDWTISIGFYVMYHCCLAILTKFGYESRNQECTLALIENLIEDNKLDEDFRKYLEAIKSAGKDKKEEEQIQQMREKYQYTPIVEIDIQKVDELLGICQDMLKDAKGVIKS